MSALSDVSQGSDEVFAGQCRDGIIHRDWEVYFFMKLAFIELYVSDLSDEL